MDPNDRFADLINSEWLSDVVFIVGSSKCERVHAHKLFLATMSDYFKAMFTGNFKESQTNEVFLNDIEKEDFLVLLRFMYCQKFDHETMTIDQIFSVYVHSSKYLIEPLTVLAFAALKERAHDFGQDCLKLFYLNRACELEEINEICLKLVTENPLFYFRMENFRKIDQTSLQMIVNSPKINCTGRQIVEIISKFFPQFESLEYYPEAKTYQCDQIDVIGQKVMVSPEDPGIFRCRFDYNVDLYGVGIHFDSALPKPLPVTLLIVADCRRKKTVNFIYESTIKSGYETFDLFFEKLSLEAGSTYDFYVLYERHHPTTGINTNNWQNNLTFSTDVIGLNCGDEVIMDECTSFISRLFLGKLYCENDYFDFQDKFMLL